MNMETKGLGAGSYPEPTEPKILNAPICESCGEEDGLRSIDGHIVCRECRKNLYSMDYQDRAWEFINSTTEDRLNFALNWWFDNLSDSEKAEVLISALKQYFSLPFYWSQHQFQSLIKSYVLENDDDFCDYLDKQGVSSEVVL